MLCSISAKNTICIDIKEVWQSVPPFDGTWQLPVEGCLVWIWILKLFFVDDIIFCINLRLDYLMLNFDSIMTCVYWYSTACQQYNISLIELINNMLRITSTFLPVAQFWFIVQCIVNEMSYLALHCQHTTAEIVQLTGVYSHSVHLFL